jgi:hypothetical protein
MIYIVILFLWLVLLYPIIISEISKRKSNLKNHKKHFECLACETSLELKDVISTSCPECKCTQGPNLMSRWWKAKDPSNF